MAGIVATLPACATTGLTPLPPRPPTATRSALPNVSTDAAARANTVQPAGAVRAIPAEEYLHTRVLIVPVAGIPPHRVPDTFRAKRGSRVHGAVDILAPRGTPVLAADAGAVFKLRRNGAGGLVIYATDPLKRLIYYYAHLDRYHPAMREGRALARGDTIGFVGTTGNAPAKTPHLHFQVMGREAGSGYWEGTPLDPRPHFTADGMRP